MQVVDGLPEDILRDVDHLTVDRRGAPDDSFMVTYEIVGHVSPERFYTIDETGVVPLDEAGVTVADIPGTSSPPPQLRLSGLWDSSVAVETEAANILGEVGVLTLAEAEIVIPEAPATAEALGYYGARLVNRGDAFRMEANANLPVTRMEIGAGYADGYLHIASKGGGSYLEHHDRPHLHMPLDADARGYLILGRRDGDDFLVSAFRIPYGSAVYTPPEALHADPYLIGNYLVVYSVTENFANAVLRNPDGGVVNVRFEPLSP